MFRTAVFKNARPLACRRLFSTSTRLMSGETGSGTARPTGLHGGDAFTKREAAAEAMYIREAEKEKLRDLKVKLAAQRQHIEELEKHIDEVTNESGGQGEQPTEK
ncbi:hypothetical protein K505DRAFT_285982 [Melanomma pulvis-pyrius CBS 109.77]|uniref:ATPase inhibitor, mitochondrial n=1 Tax=Melanomma pulvis-pyrius CBS 109.77 TaxID=1314802 RepID=A0A6A6WX91_9PLEO|nr:hypothetical protein K505DRAFT_285982 [Melanomma pulvis-pyrius CBS 109.77]